VRGQGLGTDLLSEDQIRQIVEIFLATDFTNGRHVRRVEKLKALSAVRLPADLDFSGMFHGVDERVPLDSLRFGVRVLDRFLDEC